MGKHILKNTILQVKQKLTKLSISSKIMIYYLIFLIVSMMASSMIFQNIYSNIVTEKISKITFQMLNSISTNFKTSIDTCSEYSKMIMANEDVLDSLKIDPAKNTEDEVKDVLYTANHTLSRLIGGVNLISSVYIAGNNGNKVYAYKESQKVLNVEEMEKAAWFDEVKKKKGAYIIKLNAGGVLKNVASAAGQKSNYVSLIREFNDFYSQKTMGTIIVNISQNALRKTLNNIISNYESEVDILNEQNYVAVGTENQLGFDVRAFAKKGLKDSDWTIWKHNNTEYMAAYLKIPENGWKIVGILPIRQLSEDNSVFSLVTILIIVANGLVLFVGSLFISRLITVPIKKLIKSMKDIEKGKFKKVEIKAGNNEIGLLRDGYNAMVVEIQNLISKIVTEQKIKRKAELDILQAQIKPHFLYNTFDSISSLALSGKNKDVYNIMKMLGTYYRTSLSKGSEVITVGEEIDVVINYLNIQKYRYEDIFTAEYDIDEETKCYKILKLVLQPFVENALYHGIRPMGSIGKITVRAKKMADGILLQVIDDGVGMDPEEVKRITELTIVTEHPSFGVRGTIERLKIFYASEDVVEIESEKGKGTKVSIRIPLQGGC